MIDFNKKMILPPKRVSVIRDITKTPPFKKKLTKENKKFLKLLKVLK